MIRGITKNVALKPVLYSEIDPAETFVPAQIELRNGKHTDIGNWIKRPGYGEKWETGSPYRVELLIPEVNGYALLANGYVYALGNTVYRLPGRIDIISRPTYVNADGRVLVAAGGRIMQVAVGGVVDLTNAP